MTSKNETEFLEHLEQVAPLAMAYYWLDYMLKCNRQEIVTGNETMFSDSEFSAQQAKIRALFAGR